MRPCLQVLIESFFYLPVKRGDEVIPWKEVFAELDTYTLHMSKRIDVEDIPLFMCEPLSQIAALTLKLDPAKYEKCISLIGEVLYHTLFTPQRVRFIAEDLLKRVHLMKTNGSNFAEKFRAYTRQVQFLSNLIEKLDSEETLQTVLDEIESIRNLMTSPGNIVIHVSANIDQLVATVGDPTTAWSKLLPAGKEPARNKLSVTPDWSPADQETDSCVVGRRYTKISKFIQTTPTIKDFNDPDLVPLLVFVRYLIQPEGPIWRRVRGLGLAYDSLIFVEPERGLLQLIFKYAANCVLAYKEVKSIVDKHLVDDAKWDQTLLESAKSSLIFRVIEPEKSVGGVVTQSLLSYFRGVDHNYNRVTPDDLNRVGPKYVAPLFDPQQCKTSVICHPTQVSKIKNGFEELGVQLEIFSC